MTANEDRPELRLKPGYEKPVGRRCTVCKLPDQWREKLHLGLMRKESVPQLARKFHLHPDAIRRHRDNPKHFTEEEKKRLALKIKEEAAQTVDAEINEEQIEVSSGLKRIVREIETILRRAKGEDDQLALTALRDMRGTLMDLAKVYGQLQEKTTIAVSINEAPEWIRLRSILGDVFREHPEAGRAFIERAQRERLSIAHDPRAA